ncbi:hypothetical protein DMUE_4339 [Dictyocoela muelleri]|nr:hypothetical protein DMUE_4339 [Dictyocoela muelleri]
MIKISFFSDETGINLNQSRNYRYSPKNTKAVKIVKKKRLKNVSCIVALKKSGIVNFEIKDGSFNGESLMCSIVNKLAINFQNNNDYILIMDNCSFHHRSKVIALLNSKNIKPRSLPAYSLQLNPIEEYFSYF